MAHSHNIVVKLDGYQKSGNPAYSIDGYVSATSFRSAPIEIMRKTGYSMQFTCPSTGSPEGTLTIEATNDEERVPGLADDNLVNWIEIPGFSSDVSGASNIIFEDRDPQYRWMRVCYERDSGSVTATIKLHTKQESGADKR